MSFDQLTPSLSPVSSERIDDERVCHVFQSTAKPLSKARVELIHQAHTEWILWKDDDVFIRPGDLERLFSYAGKDVGGIESNVYGMFERTRIRSNRAWLGFALVRRELVLDWNPPPLQRYEDEHLRRHVEKKGFRWITALDVPVTHQRRFANRDFYHDGLDAQKVLDGKDKLWMIIKTPIMIRRGKRFISHLYFLAGLMRP